MRKPGGAAAVDQVASDKMKAANRAVQDTAAQGLGAAQEALDTKNKPSSDIGTTGEWPSLRLCSEA